MNVWSMKFCFQIFEKIQPEDFRPGIAKYLGGQYTVTRSMPTVGIGFPPGAAIRFSVTLECSKVCYIAYTEVTGVTLFMVTKIRKPIGEDWSNTLRGYQVFTTGQALGRVDRKDDAEHVGCATSWGADSLQKELEKDRECGQLTYHPTDWEVPMDGRCIVGVVRRAQDSDRGKVDEKRYANWLAKTSLIYTGLAFSASE